MNQIHYRHIYGPVPSRRLGRSLGIDLVPLKVCTYNCVYCQLGRTTKKTVERKEYVPVEEVIIELKQFLASGETPDYIGISGSGEPTLNDRIGDLIAKIRSLTRIPLAVLTNGSLLWMSEVQDALMEADLVIPSLDAGDEQLFRYVNRPHRSISFERMVDGIAEFTRRFQGEVWLESLLLDGVTGIPAEVEKIAALAKRIGPARVQLNTAARPPAEKFAFAIAMDQMKRLAGLFSGKAEVISDYEGSGFSAPKTGEATDENILSLLSRRPCTLQGISLGLGMNPSEVIKRLQLLSRRGTVRSVRRNSDIFYEKAGANDKG